MQKASCLFHFFSRRGKDIFQRVGDAQFLPLVDSQRVVGKHLHPLHIGEGADKGIHFTQVRLLICEAGDKDVAYPDRHAQLIKEAGHVQDVVISPAGQPKMSRRVHHLQIQEHKVHVLHQLQKPAVKGLFPGKGGAGGVEGSVDAGVVYCTDAYSAGLTPVDEATKEMCGQVIYPAAVMKNALHAEAAKEFLAYLRTDKAATVFESVGFTAL